MPRRKSADVFTTGDVAALCRVAPRTAAKWIDTGLLKGFRLAGSKDRRVTRAELVRFLAANGMPPLEEVLGDRPRRILVYGRPPDLPAELGEVGSTGCLFEAGRLYELLRPDLVLVDCRGPAQDVRSVTVGVRSAGHGVPLVGLLDREDGETDRDLFDETFRHPVEPDVLAARLAFHLRRGRRA